MTSGEAGCKFPVDTSKRNSMNRWALVAVLVADVAAAQVVTGTEPQRGGGRGRGTQPPREMWRTAADTQRARQLFVSRDTTDLPKLDSAGHAFYLADRARIEANFE